MVRARPENPGALRAAVPALPRSTPRWHRPDRSTVRRVPLAGPLLSAGALPGRSGPGTTRAAAPRPGWPGAGGFRRQRAGRPALRHGSARRAAAAVVAAVALLAVATAAVSHALVRYAMAAQRTAVRSDAVLAAALVSDRLATLQALTTTWAQRPEAVAAAAAAQHGRITDPVALAGLRALTSNAPSVGGTGITALLVDTTGHPLASVPDTAAARAVDGQEPWQAVLRALPVALITSAYRQAGAADSPWVVAAVAPIQSAGRLRGALVVRTPLLALRQLTAELGAGLGVALHLVDGRGQVLADPEDPSPAAGSLPQDLAVSRLLAGPQVLRGAASRLDTNVPEDATATTAAAAAVPGRDWSIVASRPLRVGLATVRGDILALWVAATVTAGLLVGGTLLWRRTVGRRRRELAAAHRRFGAIYAASPVGIVETDLALRVLDCNAAFAALTGQPRAALLGCRLPSLLGPAADGGDDPRRAGTRSAAASAAASASASAAQSAAQAAARLAGAAARWADPRAAAGPELPPGGERLLRPPPGMPGPAGGVPVAVAWAAIAGEDGGSVGYVAACTDLTAQVAARSHLTRARERAEVLFDRAPVGLLEATPDGVVTRVNGALAAMLDLPAAALVGRPCLHRVAPESVPAVRADLAAMARGTGVTGEWVYLGADDRRVPVLVSTAVLHDTAGRIERFAAFVVDLSAQRAQQEELAAALADLGAAHAELAEREAFSAALLETVDVAILSCDATGRTVRRNRAHRDLAATAAPGASAAPTGAPAARTGAPADPPPLPEVYDDAGRLLPPEQHPLPRVFAGEDIGELTLRTGPAGGPHRAVLVRGRRITAPDGTGAGAVVAMTDITELRRLAAALEEQRSQLLEAQRLGRLGSFEVDPVTGAFALSPELCRLWGYDRVVSSDELVTALHRDDRERLATLFSDTLARGGKLDGTFRIRHARTGAERVIRHTLEVERDPDGQVRRAAGTHQDVTDITAAQRQAQEASAQLEAILNASPDVTVVTDVATGGVVYVSPGKRLAGLGSRELAHRGRDALLALVHPDDQESVRAADAATGRLADGEVAALHYRSRGTDGGWHWLSRRVTPFRRDAATGAVTQLLGVLRDVTDVVEAERQLAHAALHDALTGLPNRALLRERMDAALAAPTGAGAAVAVLFVDLDGFKRVNDGAGHAAGDRVLVQAAHRIIGALRDGDTVARVGGDEFVVLLDGLPGSAVRGAAGHLPAGTRGGAADGVGAAQRAAEAVAVQRADELVQALRAPFVVDGVEHVVTASVGIAVTVPGTGRYASGQDLLGDADTAMYRAKGRGKDRVEVFQPALRADVAQRDRVERALREALDSRPARPGGVPQQGRRAVLRAVYQPVVSAATGALRGFEALARLTDAAGHPIAPELFIGVAEDTGLIAELGQRMLDAACGQLARWRRELPGLEAATMAVNVSALQARHGDLVGSVRQALQGSGLAPADLVLELTETALLQAAAATLAGLQELRDDGVGIAIDDFGTGYASLRYLATLPVSGVKVDRSFTAGLPDDPTRTKIVHAVISLAADLGLDCVVEGVETAAQHAALPDTVLVQGWLTGRPAGPGELDLVGLLVGSAAGHAER